ncbi:hypothetical protein FB45DRAFT_1068202 [Roridomyces roridus]|uniref:Uncharacterized protein n=1 Tax=Roridomyces roridus TaxID=1738132 RepID=A0AAD7B0Q2_9AGAR|nr:hypothetical protein FB45DRAFT_1068202 [Roridomyces roridus]
MKRKVLDGHPKPAVIGALRDDPRAFLPHAFGQKLEELLCASSLLAVPPNAPAPSVEASGVQTTLTRAIPLEIEENVNDGSGGFEGLGAGEFVAGKVEGASIGFQELSLDVLMDESLPTHSTAVIALQNIFAIIDDIRVIVRDLCGETTFRGFDALQHEFLGREEAALGTFARQ